MAALHTVNKSPYEKNSLESCMRVATEGSTILLIEDAVYAATRGTALEARIREAGNRFKLCALAPDLAARGLDPEQVVDGIELVDYERFVDLAAAHDNVQAWL